MRTIEASVGESERGGAQAWARIIAGLTLAASSGVAATAAFPPYGLWPLIFVAFVPMIVAQYFVLPRRLSGVAAGLGIGTYVAGYVYGLVDPNFALWLRAIPLVVVVVVSIACSFDRRRQEAVGFRRFVFVFPLTWAAFEFLRNSTPGIGTRGYLAYALFRQTWFIQPVSVFSIHALNLLIVLVNFAVGALVLSKLRGDLPIRATRMGALGVGLAFGAWTILSLVLLRSPAPTVRVATIQPGTAAGDAEEFDRNVRQTRDAVRRGASLVVWREKSILHDPRRTPERLRSLAKEGGTYIALGYQVLTDAGQRNEATLIAPDGRFLGTYGKQHPAIMFADDLTSVTSSDVPVYRTPFGRTATMICFDLDFTDTARSAARRGAQILAVPSWDPPGDAKNHYTLLVFRAIENRLTMLKSDAAHDSAIIDPYGRIIAVSASSKDHRATLVADVPLGSGKSPWVSFGEVFGWLTVAAALAVMVLDVRTWRRARRH